MSLYFVMDCESVGLHGKCFAWAYVVVDETGKEIDKGYRCLYPTEDDGSIEDLVWVTENVLPHCSVNGTDSLCCGDMFKSLRYEFLMAWRIWSGAGAYLCADVAWPVEARFLAQLIDDNLEHHAYYAPYPLIDIASVRFAKGLDPVGTVERLPNELPAHNPLNDARQSARLLIEALKL